MNEQAYVKAVAKNLAASKQRNNEFVRDLESDIADALSAGETWEQIELRMGDPRHVAYEFNDNLSEKERAAGKKRKRTKVIAIVAAVVIVIIAAIAIAAWWFLPSQHTAGQQIGVDEQTVIAQAEEAIGYLNADDFAGLESISIEAMADPSAKASIEEARDLISSDWGEFESFGSAYAAEVVQAGQVVEVAEIVAVYENVSVTYTIMFNEDMVLTGLYMK